MKVLREEKEIYLQYYCQVEKGMLSRSISSCKFLPCIQVDAIAEKATCNKITIIVSKCECGETHELLGEKNMQKLCNVGVLMKVIILTGVILLQRLLLVLLGKRLLDHCLLWEK